MTTELIEIYTDVLFEGPHTITIEASTDEILEQNLDISEGEHFDYIKDVLHIDFNRSEGTISFHTCRTLKRPLRSVVTIPRKSIAHVFARRQGEYE